MMTCTLITTCSSQVLFTSISESTRVPTISLFYIQTTMTHTPPSGETNGLWGLRSLKTVYPHDRLAGGSIRNSLSYPPRFLQVSTSHVSKGLIIIVSLAAGKRTLPGEMWIGRLNSQTPRTVEETLKYAVSSATLTSPFSALKMLLKPMHIMSPSKLTPIKDYRTSGYMAFFNTLKRKK